MTTFSAQRLKHFQNMILWLSNRPELFATQPTPCRRDGVVGGSDALCEDALIAPVVASSRNPVSRRISLNENV